MATPSETPPFPRGGIEFHPVVWGDANSLPADDQSYDADLESTNDLTMVDPDDFVTEQSENEKNDVAIINPDTLGNDVDMEKPRADDCRCRFATISWTRRIAWIRKLRFPCSQIPRPIFLHCLSEYAAR
jgi:hypothetical protein